MRNLSCLIIALLVFTAQAAFASVPALQNLSINDANKALDNLGAGLYFRSVEPPSSNGKIWGIGLGIVGSATTLSQIKDVTGTKGAMPAADIVATAQAPLGIALETGFLPTADLGNITLKRFSMNLKWTWTDVFSMPVISAVRLGFGSTSLNWRDSATSANYSYKGRFTEFQVSVSQKLAILEPYLGLGLVAHHSDLSATGTTPIASGQYSFGREKSSFWLSGGAELRLLILSLGAQLDRALGETSASVRIGMKF